MNYPEKVKDLSAQDMILIMLPAEASIIQWHYMPHLLIYN